MMRRHRKKRQWDPALEPNPYRETADRISSLLDEFAAALPKLEPSEMKTTAEERRAARKVSLPFIERIIVMAEASDDPRIHEHYDIAKMRDSLELVKAVRPVLPVLSTFANSLNESIRSKMAILTGQVKETYEAALKIPPEERSEVVIKFIEDLKPFFGKRVRRRKRE
jgi:hypothetical protein